MRDALRFAEVPLRTGLRLHYAEQGDPAGPAILFLHGYSDSWFSFSRILPLLSPSYHAFAISLRGHGDSDKPDCCYTVDDYAADVLAFMDALDIDRATLVGHSGGTLIAPRVALSDPHRVTHLVLIGSAIMGAHNGVVAELAEAVDALNDPVPPDFVREFQESTIFQPVPDEFLETVVAESLKLPAHVWRGYMEGVILTPDHTTRLLELNVPTLIIWGEQDALFLRPEQDRLERAIRNATLRIYPETGHTPHWERPEQVVRDLEEFVQKPALA